MKPWNPGIPAAEAPRAAEEPAHQGVQAESGLPRRADYPAIPRLLLCFAIALVAIAAGAVAVWWGALNQDEGWYLYAAKMTASGYLPYRDYFFTQGPALPFVYAVLAPLWENGGILAARILTFAIGAAASVAAAVFAASLAPKGAKGAAGATAFALLACNLYHVYFTTIPKTYALGTLFLTLGFVFFAKGERLRRALEWALAGFLMALAGGTRISLALAPAVCGLALLSTFKTRRFAFLWFGAGAALGVFLTYGLFALDPESMEGILEAQKYHAGRGGFDWVFIVGSLSRMVRGYAAVAVVTAVAGFAPLPFVARTAVAACVAVMALQLSAPFPYDDYQVPVIPPLVAVISMVCAAKTGWKGAALAFWTAGVASFSSPLIQEWATCGQDRFWSIKRESSALAQLRETAREIEKLDPDGKEILTQDLYLAVEMNRRVPRGFEMGPFSYFPDFDDAKAARLNVLNKNLLLAELAKAEPAVAAGSGYAFAISVPSCAEVPIGDQLEFWYALKDSYDHAFSREAFGQNNTRLTVMKKRNGAAN